MVSFPRLALGSGGRTGPMAKLDDVTASSSDCKLPMAMLRGCQVISRLKLKPPGGAVLFGSRRRDCDANDRRRCSCHGRAADLGILRSVGAQVHARLSRSRRRLRPSVLAGRRQDPRPCAPCDQAQGLSGACPGQRPGHGRAAGSAAPRRCPGAHSPHGRDGHRYSSDVSDDLHPAGHRQARVRSADLQSLQPLDGRCLEAGQWPLALGLRAAAVEYS